MQCPNCGKDNAPGTRFCVHCGTAQPAATAPAAPASTVTAAMAQGGIPGLRDPVTPRAAAPHADATVSTRSGAAGEVRDLTGAFRSDAAGSETVVIPRGTFAPPPMAADPAQEAADWLPPPPTASIATPPAADTPAYSVSPSKRSGILIVLALAAVGVLGIAAFVAYNMWSDRQHGEALASSADSGAPAGPAAGAITPPASIPVPTDTAPRSDASAEPPRPEPAAVTAPVTSSTVAAPTVTPSPASEPPRPAASTPRPKAAPRTPAPKADAPPPPVAAPQPAPAPAPKAAPAPPPRPAAPTDRWAQMHDDLQRCTREDFINRVVCDQRVRLRYCEGYWGKVAQCPGAATADHGQ